MTEATSDRERRVGRKFVQLADSLVSGFDVAELLDDLVGSAVELLDLGAAGLMLTDPSGQLRVMAASSERTRTLELFELQSDEGPCLDCFRLGTAIIAEEPAEQRRRWPSFAAEIGSLGFGAVYAVPMRLRERTLGAFNLFSRPDAPLSSADLDLAQALADVATIAIMQHRAISAERQLAEQLQIALNTRIAIEQAKGAIAERAQIDMDAAFRLLRGYARRTQSRLSIVATAVASGQMSPSTVINGLPAPGME